MIWKDEAMRAETSTNLTRKKKAPKQGTPDYILLGMILLIVAFGVVMVYSASFDYSVSKNKPPASLAIKQLIIGIGGIVAMLWVTYRFDYHIFSNRILARGLYAISLILSISVMFIGTKINGARRWIELGPIQFQPSEIAKIAVVIMLSSYIISHRKHMNKLKYIAGAWLIVLVPTIIVALENLSSAIVILGIGCMIIFVSSTRIWYYVLLVILAVALAGGAYYLAMITPQGEDPNIPIVNKILPGYRLDRIRVWQDPWTDPLNKGYQPIQSLYAVGSGGLFGVGLGNGVQKQGFLPEPYNDIIFAVICEELGLVGAIVLMTGYAIIIIRGMGIAMRAPDYFGSLVAVGIASMVGIQALINVAVNTNTIPTTGMQLPLVSYGGTALAVLLGTLGILLNVSRSANIQKATK